MNQQLPNRPPMSRQSYRSIGAISGLGVSVGLMATLGLKGIVAAAIFGASGAVIGGIAGERFHDRRNEDSES